MSYQIKGCQSCGGQVTKFLDLGYHPPPMVFASAENNLPETNYPLQVGRCDNCGMVQNLFVVDPKLLFASGYFYNSAATASFAKHLDGLAEVVTQRFHPKLVVDIGSSDGTLLKGFQERGAKVLGIEPSAIAEIAKKNGIPTINAFFSEDLVSKFLPAFGLADVITATNVFGHIADIDSTVRGIDKLLKPDGVFVSEHTYLLDMVQKLEYDVIYHEHLRHYDLVSLSRLLLKRGFQVFDAERIPTFGGSIRVYAEKLKADVQYSTRLGEILTEEKDASLQDNQTYLNFAKRVRKSKIDLNALLYALKSEGKSIVGVGAPARASTLLGYCSIGPDLLDYVAETSELKIGRLTPLTRVPVVDEKRIYEDQPDYALLLSWHLSDYLIPSLREKGFKGKFILPLPNMRVIE